MVEESHFTQIQQWWSLGVASDVKTWLTLTVRSAATYKQNLFGLPWDVVDNGSDGKVVSTLPEVLRKQLNVYQELCVDGDRLRDSGYSNGITDQQVHLQT